MKVLQYVARKSLLALGYPRLETSHPELGVYEVGAYRGRIPSSSPLSPSVPACQFFYPVATTTTPNSKTTTTRRERKRNRMNTTKNKKFVPYYRKEGVDGLLDFMNGFGDGILQLLQEKAHPLQDTYGMDPLVEPTTTTQQFPLVLFSHGLGGTMDMYTELCAQLASTGCVVVALEHEDGSASYAAAAAAVGDCDNNTVDVVVPYQRPLANAEVPYSRQKVLDFRTPMLEHRVEELRRIYDAFVVAAAEASSPNDGAHNAAAETSDDECDIDLLRKIVSRTDPSKLHLVGHSFGGATQLLATQTWAKQDANSNANAPVPAVREMAMAMASDGAATSSDLLSPPSSEGVSSETRRLSEVRLPRPLSITVYDAWNTALSDQVLEDGLGGHGSSNGKDNGNGNDRSTPEAPLEILSVLSEGWATGNPEREQTLEFLRNCRAPDTHVRSCYATASLHQSISDTEAYAPSVVARTLGNRGQGEPRHRTIRAVVREIAKFTNPVLSAARSRHSNDHDDDDDNVLMPFPL